MVAGEQTRPVSDPRHGALGQRRPRHDGSASQHATAHHQHRPPGAARVQPLCPGLPAPTQDTALSVATVDAAFKQSFQAGDLDATMALFAPETVEISPFGVFPGKDAIRRSVDTFIRANPGLQVSFSDSQIVENTAVHHVTLTSDAIRALASRALR